MSQSFQFASANILPSWRKMAVNTALRRDKVWAGINTYVDVPGCVFIATFPENPGDELVRICLAAKSLEAACAEIDQRWPMAAWWSTLGENDMNPRAAT